MIKVALIEDKEETLRYLEALLQGSKGLTVVGAYETGTGAIADVPRKKPDVVLADLGLPDISGIEVIRTIKLENPAIDVVAYTLYEDREHLIGALTAGASGYILKGASAVEIIQSIEAVVAGGSPMSPKIARYIIEDYCGQARKKDGAVFSPREKEVLEGIAKGRSERQLAEQLSLSPHTIHSHVKSIYKKLHVNSQAQAVLRARKQGLI